MGKGKRRSLLSVFFSLVLTVGILAGCSGGQSAGGSGSGAAPAPASGSGSGAAPSDKAKVALIMHQPMGDPFADMVYSGLQKLAKERPLETRMIEAKEKAEYGEQVRAMAELGFNPVIVLWDELGHEVVKIAKDFPKTNFIILDSYVTDKQPNIKNVVIDPQEASFLAGVAGGLTTKTNQLGFVGGNDSPTIIQFLAGFEAGAKWANPNAKVSVRFAGTFTDPQKGQEMALSLFNGGADVVMHAANKTGLGVLKAAQETGKWGVGVDMYQGDVAPKHVLWSAIKPADVATYTVAKQVLDGKFTPGTWVYTLKEGATLYDDRDFNAAPANVQAKIKEAIEAIKTGKVTVPKETATR